MAIFVQIRFENHFENYEERNTMKTTGNTLNMGKIKLWTISALLMGAILLFLCFRDRMPNVSTNEVSFTIVDRWELPLELREISAIAWLDTDRIAAVQDEQGTIFIYDIKKREVAKKIEFGRPGDYEGLAIHQKDAYVLESNGKISEIKNFQSPERKVNFYETNFKTANNMESLVLDVEQDRLLMVPKDRDLTSTLSKGIYSFALDVKKLDSVPAFKIDMGDDVLKRFRENEMEKTFRPSDLAIHPRTKEIYVLEGSKPKLLILDADGNAKKAYALDKKRFPQPEGITFGPDGTLYISSEGKKNTSGTITELKLRQ